MTYYEMGDVVMTRGSGIVSRLIRKFTTSKGEEPTEVNHVGIVVYPGTLGNAIIVEALETGVKRHRLARYVGTSSDVAVARMRGLSEKDQARVVAAAEEYEGRAYGYLKLATQWLDWAIGGRYLFRRLSNMDEFPICSWIVASAYGRIGVSFGVRVGEATPDDIWDHIVANPAQWEWVHGLTPLTKDEL